QAGVREVVERRNQLAPREISTRAEDHHRARRGDLLVGGRHRRRDRRDARAHAFSFTACPPNSARSAASIRSLNESSWRERKRRNSESASTGAGTPRSIASSTVQRPSPESSTYPRIFSRPGSLPNARSASSSSHERTTLP